MENLLNRYIDDTFHEGKVKWLNVQNVETKSLSQRKHGKWLADQISKAKDFN